MNEWSVKTYILNAKQVTASAKCINVKCRWKFYVAHLQFNPVCDSCTLHLCMHFYMCVNVWGCLFTGVCMSACRLACHYFSPVTQLDRTADSRHSSRAVWVTLAEILWVLEEKEWGKNEFYGRWYSNNLLIGCVREARISVSDCDHWNNKIPSDRETERHALISIKYSHAYL